VNDYLIDDEVAVQLRHNMTERVSAEQIFEFSRRPHFFDCTLNSLFSERAAYDKEDNKSDNAAAKHARLYYNTYWYTS